MPRHSGSRKARTSRKGSRSKARSRRARTSRKGSRSKARTSRRSSRKTTSRRRNSRSKARSRKTVSRRSSRRRRSQRGGDIPEDGQNIIFDFHYDEDGKIFGIKDKEMDFNAKEYFSNLLTETEKQIQMRARSEVLSQYKKISKKDISEIEYINKKLKRNDELLKYLDKAFEARNDKAAELYEWDPDNYSKIYNQLEVEKEWFIAYLTKFGGDLKKYLANAIAKAKAEAQA